MNFLKILLFLTFINVLFPQLLYSQSQNSKYKHNDTLLYNAGADLKRYSKLYYIGNGLMAIGFIGTITTENTVSNRPIISGFSILTLGGALLQFLSSINIGHSGKLLQQYSGLDNQPDQKLPLNNKPKKLLTGTPPEK